MALRAARQALRELLIRREKRHGLGADAVAQAKESADQLAASFQGALLKYLS